MVDGIGLIEVVDEQHRVETFALGPEFPSPLLQIAEKARIHVTARQVGQFAR